MKVGGCNRLIERDDVIRCHAKVYVKGNSLMRMFVQEDFLHVCMLSSRLVKCFNIKLINQRI